jgi:hypothetical protein
MAPPGGSSGARGDFATTGVVKLVEGLGEASYAQVRAPKKYSTERLCGLTPKLVTILLVSSQ